MAKPTILLANPIHEDAITFLEESATVTKAYGISPVDLVKAIAAYDAIITRSDNAITPELIDAGINLKVVGRAAIGVDNIDIAYATKKKVAVVNAPTGNCKAAAEHTIGLMFALARHIPSAHEDMRQGIWGKHKYIGMQLEGKTLGVIGLGRVGEHVARIADGIGMRVIYYDPFVFTKDYEKVTLDELLQTADIVTLHTPHTKLTNQIINEHSLKQMKQSAYLINCARGKVIDEAAVINALRTKQIAGAALDVYEKEPLAASELTQLDNVILTPHIGGSTVEAQRATGMEVAQGVLRVLQGEKPDNVLNPEIFVPEIKYFSSISTIIFDCDSTLVSIEGIDELARSKGVEKEIIPLTEKAMNGELSTDEVFKKRLEIIKPTKKELLTLGNLYINSLLPGTKDIIMRLKNQGIKIYIVSGGYDLPLNILADYLDIPRRNVHANKIQFTSSGEYKGLDESIPLWKKGGKSLIINKIPKNGKSILVGDGITDAEAKDSVDIFIGFGGIKRREIVKKAAHIYLETPTLAPLLHIAKENVCRHNLMSSAERDFLFSGLDHILNPEITTFMFDYHKAEIMKQLLT